MSALSTQTPTVTSNALNANLTLTLTPAPPIPEPPLAVEYVVPTYVCTMFVVLLCAVYSLVHSWRRINKEGKLKDIDEFVTARRMMSRWRIAWSFFTSALGAWAIATPANFAVWGGLLGNGMYALATGLPILIIAFFGELVTSRYPQVMSFSDFVGMRFGIIAQIFASAVLLLNMSIALLAEYTTMGSLFKDYVGTEPYSIIVVVFCATIFYTAYGGLEVSIVTDAVQSVATILFASFIFFYCVATFRHDLPPLYTEQRVGWGNTGYGSIWSMPCSMICATIYSEAMWSRCWASQSKAALRFGALYGCIGLSILIFMFGFAGWLANWAGNVTYGVTNDNLYLIQVLKDQTESGSAHVKSWIGVIVVVLAAVMNESAVDSLQNGLVACVSGVFFKDRPVLVPRILCFLLNIPIMAVALKGYNILKIFLLGNLITTCFTPPFLMGIYKGRFSRYITGIGATVSSLAAMVFVSWFGYHYSNEYKVGDDLEAGLNFAWLDNSYDYNFFLIACFTSFGTMLATMPVAWLFEKLFPQWYPSEWNEKPPAGDFVGYISELLVKQHTRFRRLSAALMPSRSGSVAHPEGHKMGRPSEIRVSATGDGCDSEMKQVASSGHKFEHADVDAGATAPAKKDPQPV